jgi:hypothetical protein
MNYTDKDIIDVIKRLKSGEGDDQQIQKWSQNELLGLDEIYDLIFYSEEDLSAEEVLERARQRLKPICL